MCDHNGDSRVELQWMPVIRTSLGVTKYVPITGIRVSFGRHFPPWDLKNTLINANAGPLTFPKLYFGPSPLPKRLDETLV